ncbi:hypothetical protein ES319_D11G151100v1 [Gossypium barbadense]|uniref:Uncharacterized protein n=2 Tax=Gossypium TaxID=3633 RepID=A0A5J5PBC8_GOSBA|nr:hypothetical protein ES319_D11G151100v1 [Gossypium barbadense]TYG45257.1 hypothetical protein ES288_D11G159300v1 [Gossypium darwinii]
MDGRRWGGDGGRGRPKRSRVSATDGGNEPREGSTSPTATQNPSAVIGQEQEAEPRRFTSHNYTRSPSRSPPQSRPPIRRTPSYPPPRTFPPSCQPPRPPPQSRPPIRRTPSYPPPRTFPPSSQPPRPPPQSRPPIRRTPSYPPPRTFPPSCQPPRPPTPTAPILPPRPLKSFPQIAEQPLRQPSLALSPRHSSPDRPQRNQPTTTTMRKRSEKSKDGNDEEGDPRRPASGIVIRDQQPPSSNRSREAQQGNSDDPDPDHTPAPGQSAGPVRDQGMAGLQNQEGKPYSDRDLPLKKRTSVRAMVDGNGGNQEGAPVAEGNPPPLAQQRYRRDRAAKGNEHQAL